MHRCFAAFAIAFGLTLSAIGTSSAADEEKLKEYRAMLKEVSAELLKACHGEFAPPAGYHWPPDIDIDPGPEIKASADAKMENGKLKPIIRVHAGMMEKVIEDDPTRLALIVAHELGHVLLKHVPFQRGVPFATAAFSRENEFAADDLASKLLLRTRFPLKDAIGAMTRIDDVMKELKRPSTSFDGFSEHPSWPDRLARLDKSRATLWKSMSAFDAGVVFLAAQDFLHAEDCFAAVVAEFPKCHEAQANLGYARLMQYCDKLPDKHIRGLDLGQVVTGGFYSRALSVPRDAIDKPLWLKAEAALIAANKERPDQPVVLANLGLAYLLHPDGKDMTRATPCFEKAGKAAEAEAKRNKNFDPLTQAQLMVNHGIKDIAEGKTTEGLARFDAAEKLARTAAGFGPDGRGTSPEIESSLLHARATAFARSLDKAEREKALPYFEAYLKAVSTKSLWWKPTFDRYTELAAALGKPASSMEDFTQGREEPVRPTRSLPLKSGNRVALSQTLEDLTKSLGPGVQTSAVPGRSLRRFDYPAESIGVLVGGGDPARVLAIILHGRNAPPIPITASGTGGKEVGQLTIGMTIPEVEKLLGTTPCRCRLVSVDDKYQFFYPAQGIAVREVDGKVAELVIVQSPSPSPKKE